MSKLNVTVICGSTRQGRYGDKPSKWITEVLNKHDGITATLVDLRDITLPFFDQAKPPGAVKDGNYGNDVANEWAKTVGAADAFVWVSPEYNHGYPAVLKNAIDWIYKEWTKKPVAFVSWGSVRGGRVVEQLRAVAVELQMAPLRNAVHIDSDVWAATKQDPIPDDAWAGVEAPAQTMITDLVWWGHALRDARAKG